MKIFAAILTALATLFPSAVQALEPGDHSPHFFWCHTEDAIREAKEAVSSDGTTIEDKLNVLIEAKRCVYTPKAPGMFVLKEKLDTFTDVHGVLLDIWSTEDGQYFFLRNFEGKAA